MKILNKFLIVLVGLMALSSCKDFLNEKPEHMIPMDGAVENVNDCKKLGYGLYASFKNPGGLAGHAAMLTDIQCDFVLPVNNNSNPWPEMISWTFNEQTSSGNAAWAALYSTVNRANFILEQVPVVQAKIQTDYDAAVAADHAVSVLSLGKDLDSLNNIIADAHTARALVRVELVKLYADAYDPANAANQLALPLWNTSALGNPVRTNMKEYYEAVLADIAEGYKVTRVGADNVYFTKGAVKALETRVHVYMQNWKAAIESATEVISGGGYGYELLSATSTSEALASPYAKMWSNDRGNEIIWKIGYVSSDEGVASLGSKFCGLTGNSELRPDFVPARDMYLLYEGTDNRAQIFFERRKTSYLHELETELLIKFPGNPALNKSTNPEYLNMPKVFRLSEIYLLRAEAYYKDGQVGMATDDLNTLRAQRIQEYRPQIWDGAALGDEIKKERIRELFMEGHRLYDLKRYHEGFTRKRQDQTQIDPSMLMIEPGNVRFTWPIPSSEFDVPGSLMERNPSNNVSQ